MFSFIKVIQYTKSIPSDDIAKDYYNKCFDGLADLNKRSNQTSQLILIMVLLTFFSKYFTTINFSDNEIDIKFLKILIPTILSYLILDWLMAAKRRRDYIFAIQQLSYRLFKIDPLDDSKVFPAIDPNTLNVMPYSFMCELLTIDEDRPFFILMKRTAIITLAFLLTITLVFAVINCWVTFDMEFRFIWPVNWQSGLEVFGFYTCLIFSSQAIFWIGYYYYKEILNVGKLDD